MQSRDEVAIVGYACRLPGARDARALWRLLRENRCSVTRITEDRFSTWNLYHPAADQRGRSYTFAAGVIDDVWGFDAGAFGMSPREAEQVDPQQRHILEVAYDALTHAGIRPSSLATTNTGVYIGASSADYATRFFSDPNIADVHMMTGNSVSILSNRISYTLDLRGPSITIDTACSSSLVALHLAAEAIRAGTIDTAIVGGINLLLSPFSYVGFSRASMLSPTGLCRPFDADADGYVRSEGAIAVVLRSMAAARKARSRIHGVVVASGMNQDGRTTGLSLPSATSQRQLLDRVYGDFGIDPSDLMFVEAHGTGTKVGDPIEADALGKGLAQRRAKPLPIGSVKSNVGHLEPVSGLAGLLKTLSALSHSVVPATLHQREPSPHIPFDELNLKVIDRNWRIPDEGGLAGINSFGFGGTNSHVVLRRDSTATTLVHLQKRTSPLPPLILTAHTKEALPEVAAALAAQWPADSAAAREYISANAHLRDLLPQRMLLRAETAQDAQSQLEEVAAGGTPANLLTGQALGSELPVAFLFSGNGSQWAGMGRGAWSNSKAFREALQEIDGHFSKALKWSVVEQLFASDLSEKLQRTTYSQPLLLALQVATVRALEAGGLVPAATLGHSVGEIAAAWAAGALSLPQAIDVVIARSRHQESAHGRGTMAALMLSEREARRLLNTIDAHQTVVAAINSWRSVTISGPGAEIDKVLAHAGEMRISARRIDTAYPFHSALVDSVRAPLLRELDGLKSLPLRRTMISSVTGMPAETGRLDAEHWWHNVRDPVLFDAAMGALIEKGISVFLEVGPKPILGAYVRDNLRDSGKRGVVVETLGEADLQNDFDPVERSISKVFLAGGAVDLQRLFGPPPAMAVPLPLYPWQHTPFSVEPSREGGTIFEPPAHPLLGRRLRTDSHEWFSTVDPFLFPWLNDHKVSGVAVFPATAYVEVLLAAGQQFHGDAVLDLRDLDIVQPLIFDGKTCFEVLTRLNAETGIAEFLSRARGGGPEWTLNVRGVIGKSPVVKGQPIPEAPVDAVTVLKSKVYQWATSLGFGYGPAFQRIRQVSFPEPKLAFGTYEPVPDALPAWTVTDLTALDAAFHALLASEEAGVADMPMKMMLPVRFASVQYFKPGVPAANVTARTVRQSPRTLIVDITLFDAKGDCIAKVEGARLVEAPVEATLPPLALTYQLTSWQADHWSQRASLSFDTLTSPAGEIGTAELKEGLLLLEAGCLHAAWKAFRDVALPLPAAAEGSGSGAWLGFYRNALLWHLEAHGLARDGSDAGRVAFECTLPEVDSIIGSLSVRHPTMTAEASALALLDETLSRTLNEVGASSAELDHMQRRSHGLLSRQALTLRHFVMANVERVIAGCAPTRLLRLLMIGTEHVDAACDLVGRFDNVEIVVADLDETRVERTQRTLRSDYPRIRCLPWSTIEQQPAGSFDLAFAIDALSELSATQHGLGSVTRVLRRGAEILAGEMAPSIFWDMIRGISPAWWARSSNAEFPVGALLTREEWVDEFAMAGLQTVTARAVSDDGHVGVLVNGVVGDAADNGASGAETAALILDGDRFRNGSTLAAVQSALHERGLTVDLSLQGSEDWVWAIDAATPASDQTRFVGAQLSRIAELCRKLADKPRRLWIVIDFGDDESEPLANPFWCAVTAAMRVAQNEYVGLAIKTLGLSGRRSVSAAVTELTMPDLETEIFIRNGTRLAFRLRHGLPDTFAPPEETSGTAAVLASRRSSSGATLEWVAQPLVDPEPGQIEISVSAVGLNFRDVMWNMRLLPEEALEDGYAGPTLGMECAGVVTRVGSDIRRFKRGDRVVAFAQGAFRSHAVVPEFAASHITDDLTFEAASTIPVAFLTAYYSLVHLAHLRKGEVVLVHGAAGGVGLAAIQIARYLGARIVGTAGTEEKRAFLRRLGVDLVCDSRSLSFIEEVDRYTAGRGVDVVLNSVAGEAMVRTMECLRPFGRFIELGKRDFFANTHIPLRPMRRNLSYFGVDVDQLIGEHTDLAQQMFADVLELFRQGELVPLPYRAFAGNRVQDAFRLMQRSGHIGKIVVTPLRGVAEVAANSGFVVDPAGVHVVIGGTGGFGLATAEWLADRGATRLVLASRSGQSSEADLEKIGQLRENGVEVAIERLDIADRAAVEQAVRRWHHTGLRGIVHAAMVLDDRLIERVDAEALEKVLRPKVDGAVNLEAAIDGLDLDYVLLFSSATTLFGNPGQYNYVAANGFVEGMARHMRARGIPGLAAAWGGIEDAGYLARNMASDTTLKRRFAGNLIPAQTALNVLDAAVDGPMAMTGSCAIARVDWSMAKRELAALRAPLFSSIATDGGARQSAEAAAVLERLKGRPVEEVIEALADIVVEEIARVLRLPIKEVDRHRPLAEIGMDSLMMLELRNTVESSLQIELPMLSLSSGITPAEVARRIAPLVTGDNQQPVPSTIVALSTHHIAVDAVAADATVRTAAVKAVMMKVREMDGSS